MTAIDELDKSSHKSRMSTKNAPAKWDEIKQIATDCGAGRWAMHKWLERGTIPAAWKLKILERSAGKISLSDMEFPSDLAEASQ